MEPERPKKSVLAFLGLVVRLQETHKSTQIRSLMTAFLGFLEHGVTGALPLTPEAVEAMKKARRYAVVPLPIQVEGEALHYVAGVHPRFRKLLEEDPRSCGLDLVGALCWIAGRYGAEAGATAPETQRHRALLYQAEYLLGLPDRPLPVCRALEAWPTGMRGEGASALLFDFGAS